MKDLVSILIPVYNSQDYISSTLQSVINQDYGNLEIIVLDDGSTDSSFSIIEEYRKRDQRIRVERRENKGIGSGRNRLLELSGGEFVFFLDSDDILSSPSLISTLVEDAKKYSSSVVAAATVSFRKKIRVKKNGYVRQYSGKEFSSLMTRPMGVFCYSHSRLIRKSLFDSFPFPEDMIFEDVVVMPWVVNSSEKVIWDTRVTYSYRINKKGLSHSPFSSSSLFEMDAYLYNIEKARKLGDRKIAFYSSIFFLTKYYYYFFKVMFSKLSVSDYLEKYRNGAALGWKTLFGK